MKMISLLVQFLSLITVQSKTCLGGFKAKYWKELTDFEYLTKNKRMPVSTPFFENTVETINFETKSDFGSPVKDQTAFIAYFSGKVNLETSGTKRFGLISDSGARLYINGDQFISGIEKYKEKDVTAGTYDILIGYM